MMNARRHYAVDTAVGGEDKNVGATATPTLDDIASSQGEIYGFSPVVAAVKHGAIRQHSLDVMESQPGARNSAKSWQEQGRTLDHHAFAKREAEGIAPIKA